MVEVEGLSKTVNLAHALNEIPGLPCPVIAPVFTVGAIRKDALVTATSQRTGGAVDEQRLLASSPRITIIGMRSITAWAGQIATHSTYPRLWMYVVIDDMWQQLAPLFVRPGQRQCAVTAS